VTLISQITPIAFFMFEIREPGSLLLSCPSTLSLSLSLSLSLNLCYTLLSSYIQSYDDTRRREGVFAEFLLCANLTLFCNLFLESLGICFFTRYSHNSQMFPNASKSSPRPGEENSSTSVLGMFSASLGSVSWLMTISVEETQDCL
jgi:hypothetical protein